MGDLGRKLNAETQDTELARAVADLVDCVFGERGRADDDDAGGGEGDDLIRRDDVAPTLSLVASTGP